MNPEFNVGYLKCEYMEEAVVAKAAPRFSWEISSIQRQQNQTAWQLIISHDLKKINADEGDTWDSGKTNGNETFGIKWHGSKLQSFNKYYWKVRAWDRDGKVSKWSTVASFITGSFEEIEGEAFLFRAKSYLKINRKSEAYTDLQAAYKLRWLGALEVIETYDLRDTIRLK